MLATMKGGPFVIVVIGLVIVIVVSQHPKGQRARGLVFTAH
jgi:hypothetical protein